MQVAATMQGEQRRGTCGKAADVHDLEQGIGLERPFVFFDKTETCFQDRSLSSAGPRNELKLSHPLLAHPPYKRGEVVTAVMRFHTSQSVPRSPLSYRSAAPRAGKEPKRHAQDDTEDDLRMTAMTRTAIRAARSWPRISAAMVADRILDGRLDAILSKFKKIEVLGLCPDAGGAHTPAGVFLPQQR